MGLRNVDTRIRMRFGEGFGLQIESERGEGTRMRLVLPFVEYTPDIEEKMNRKQHSTK